MVLAEPVKKDILIIVPKADELNALEWAFSKRFEEADDRVWRQKICHFIDIEVPGIESQTELASGVVVFMNDQGNTKAAQITQAALNRYQPDLAILFGTAAGAPGEIAAGSVLLAELVYDVQEWASRGQGTSPRAELYRPDEDVLGDLRRYVARFPKTEWQDACKEIPDEICGGTGQVADLWKKAIDVRMKAVASMNTLHRDPGTLTRLHSMDDRILGIDMESAGFAAECANRTKWMVIRGISDYATDESKKDPYRIAASCCSSRGSFLKGLLRHIRIAERCRKSRLTSCHQATSTRNSTSCRT